jgi:hypothetical protein
MSNININIILLIVIGIIILFLLSTDLQYFLTYLLFSNVAPSNPNEKYRKYISNKLYDIKYNIEENNKINIANDCKLSKVNTVYYSDISDKLDNKLFQELTKNYTQPLLIKNIFTEDNLKEYNTTTMSQKYGDIIIDAINTTDDVTNINTTFGNYIERINNGEKWYLTVNNSLGNALDTNHFIDFYYKFLEKKSIEYVIKNIFIGNRGSFTHLHCELASSCGLQLDGIKKWYLIDPKYSKMLHSIIDKSKIFHVSKYGFNKKDSELESIPRYEVLCEKGDFIFVPPWWWHETLNLTNSNIMFSVRPTLFIAPYKTNLLYTLLGIKNSLAYNDYIYHHIVNNNLIDKDEDTVVNSIKEINLRNPYT